MADDKTRATNAEGQPIKENTAPAAGDPGGRVVYDITDKLTFEGDPVFSEVITDPETGELLEYKLTPEMQEKLEAKYKEIAQAGATLAKVNGATLKKMQDAANKAIEPIIKASAATNRLMDTINKSMEPYKRMTSAVKDIANTLLSEETRQMLKELQETMKPLQDLLNEIEALEPYLKAELSKPEYAEDIAAAREAAGENCTITEPLDIVLHTLTPSEMIELLRDKDSYLRRAFDAAREAKSGEPLDIETYRAEKLNTPVDRVNFLAWDNFKETGGQLKFDMRSEQDKNDPKRRDMSISMRYSLSFGDNPNIKTTKELNHYDRRLTQAIDTLITSGKDIMLPSEIFYGMGGTGRIGDTQLKNINDSLTKQGTARVYINNKEEAAQYDYPEIVYDGNVLNFERIVVRYKGQEREAIKMLRRPVLMEFADQRNQLTAVPMKALQSDISKTDNHLRIEDYLLYRIARQKNDLNELQEQQAKRYNQQRQKKIREARKLTILLATFYERTGNQKKKAIVRQRALDTAKRYLTHYQSEAGGYYIDSFSIEDDRIIINLPIKK